MVLPNRQIARSFFGFAVPGPSSGQSAGFVNRFTHSLAGAVLLVLLTLFAVVANAADLTWDNGAATGNWNTTDANFGGLWTNGNTAIFGGTPGSTVTLTAPISATGVTFNVTGDILTGNTLTLTGTPAISTGGNAATINSILDGTAGVVVEGGGTVNFGGDNLLRSSNSTTGLLVGSTSANNTVNIANGGKFATIAANFRSLSIGNSTFGGNTVNISTPGTSASPSYFLYGSSAQLNMGVSSSNNQLNITNGALVSQTSSGGTNTSSIGTNPGANGNAIIVDGLNTVYSRSGAGGSYLNVGAAGDNNTITIQNGGTFNTVRLAAGSNGGDGNVAKVTGAGSLIYSNGGTNAFFDVGTTSGSLNNAFKVEAGAKFNFSGGRSDRYAAVGVNVGADSNFIQVTGVGSTMNVNYVLPIGIGAKALGTALTAGGNSNSLNVYDGGAFTITAPIYVGATVALGGAVSTGNSVNLGNGTSNTASLTVGASAAQFNTAAGYDGVYTVPGTTTAVAVQANSYILPTTGSLTTQGINLIDSSSVLTFNNGRLVAGDSFSGTPLVSGLGGISLAGPAYFSVGGTNSNSIANTISGLGSLTKEGIGTLTLSGLNTYSGDTSVLAGTLSIAAASLSDLADVYLYTGSTFNLGYASTDIIDSFFIDGVAQNTGIWGSLGSGAAHETSHLTGSGLLNVTTAPVPEPGTLVLLFTGLAFAGFSWRKRLASSRN